MSHSPTTAGELLDLVRETGLIHEDTLIGLAHDLPADPGACADALVQADALTAFQSAQLLAGNACRLVLGKYRLLRPLGTGGMGVVYLATDPALGRRVAIKVLKDERSGDEQALDRLFREARATAALDHPNIVRLHDIAQTGATHFLVMEYVDGSDLQALVNHSGPLDWAVAAGHIAQAASGLQHAHELGFVHRDIKPANLILAKNGTVKVLDLGLARCVANPRDALTDRLNGAVVVGTADYLSPEQFLNDPFDARSDVYSLGATLFTLLTGRPPYEGTLGQKLKQHQWAPPRDASALNPNVPKGLSAVVARMMAKKPGDRFQTMRDVVAALAPWVARPSADRAPRPGRDWRPAGALAAVVLALAVVAGGLYLAPHRTAPAPGAEPVVLAAPAPGAPSKMPLYSFDLSGMPPFAFRYRDGEATDPDWRTRVPPGVFLFCWKRESVAEFRADADAGRPWIGVTNLNDDLSAQILFQFEDELKVPTVPGRRYRVQIEYKAAPDVEGAVAVRNPKNGEFPSLAESRVEGTGGKWKVLELTFRRPVDGKIDVCVVSRTVGDRHLLAVRSVEVFEADPEN